MKTLRSSHHRSLCGAPTAFLALAFLLCGCGPTIPQLRATAAGEMNCPVPELKLERVNSKTMAVIGCGRETIYSQYCDETPEGKTCGWRAEPPSEEGE